MRLFTIVSNPRDVTRREYRIEKTKQSRWTIKHGSLQHTLHTDDPFAIPVQVQIASNTGTRTIRAYQVARGYRARRRTGVKTKCKFSVVHRMVQVTCLRKPIDTRE